MSEKKKFNKPDSLKIVIYVGLAILSGKTNIGRHYNGRNTIQMASDCLAESVKGRKIAFHDRFKF